MTESQLRVELSRTRETAKRQAILKRLWKLTNKSANAPEKA